MAQKIQMNFKRGDTQHHYFQMLEDGWIPGGTLSFTAKPAIDNDNSDTAAVIDKTFTDDDIVDSLHEEYLEGYVTYELKFDPGDISGVSFDNGEKVKRYLGEFQYVSAIGEVETFPDQDDFLDVHIYADVKRSA